MNLMLGRLQLKLKTQLQSLNTLGVVLSDRNDCEEVKLWVAASCERALQVLINLKMMAERKGIRFLTELVVGEDPTTDLTGTDFTSHETEELTGSLASLDKITQNGQLTVIWGSYRYF